MNYKGITAADSGNARLSEKIPERSEDDFSRNRQARPCSPKEAGANFAR